jgi:5,10-methenyltetrahydrofolate synthetase
MVTTAAQSSGRPALRERLAGVREAWLASHPEASAALAAALAPVLRQLEPEVLGLYWAIRSEFNAAACIVADKGLGGGGLALPYCTRSPRTMQYRRWDGGPPTQTDDCGIPSTDGPDVVPDVVLVPCVGYAAGGWRLGYGGGFFDRWLAAHPGVTTIGVAWSCGEMGAHEFVPEAHDRPLDLVVTERGIAA